MARIKREFSNASHNVPVYLVGHGSSVTAHYQRRWRTIVTAGRPALAVLRGSGLGDVAVVVTRYFGGTKLGTGGLVRAYGDAVRAVLEELPLAEKVAFPHRHGPAALSLFLSGCAWPSKSIRARSLMRSLPPT